MVATRVPDASAYGDSGAGQLVRAYLESKGMPYTPDNVRRALDANARDSTTMGPDPIAGLRNSAASTEPPSGRSKSVADKIEGNPPPADLSKVPNAEEYPGFSPTGTDTKTTSAQPGDGTAPSGGGLDVSNIGQMIAQGLALGGAAAGGGYLLGGNRPNYQLGMNEPGVPATTAEPGGNPVGDQYRLLPPDAPSPMDMAMHRAMQPAGIPYDPSSANMDAILNSGRMPPGVSPTDAVNAGQALPTVAQPPAPPPGERIPITPKVGPQPPVKSLPEIKGGRLLEGLLRR
jgi:hypothetical protein